MIKFFSKTDPPCPVASRPWAIGRSPSLALLLCLAVAALGGCGGSSTEPCPLPVEVSGAVTSPVQTSGNNPSYTDEARQARIQGIVILQLVIDCRGDVTDVTVLQGLPLGLTEAAVDAVQSWRYRPATLNGEPISVFFNISINFRLQ